MDWQHSRTDSVMAINDSLVGDDLLVSWAAKVTRPGGKLHLTHMEHDEIFERYMTAIGKIPELDTETARETLLHQLIREPKEWIATARAVLAAAGERLEVVEHVLRGHRVADYRAIIESEEVDLVVFPTLEEDRIALHGVAYSLAVELVQTPLLMV
jgi:nucleotide-binding universal stress UspA family protein